MSKKAKHAVVADSGLPMDASKAEDAVGKVAPGKKSPTASAVVKGSAKVEVVKSKHESKENKSSKKSKESKATPEQVSSSAAPFISPSLDALEVCFMLATSDLLSRLAWLNTIRLSIIFSRPSLRSTMLSMTVMANH
jgi:hypothetical protein